MKKNILLAVWFVMLGLQIGWSQEAAKDSVPKLGYKSSGYVYWENFRLWKADYSASTDILTKGGTNQGDWFNDILGGFVLENTMSEKLRTRVALEASFYRPFPETNFEVSRFTKPSVNIHEAKAVYSFGDALKTPVEMEVGYFLYDYNKDQHDLGEYLFRSKIYPLNLFTNFELPMARLLGIRLGNRPFQGFHHDLILTSESNYYPKSDFSVAYVAEYSIGKVLQIGAGASCVHCIAVKPSLELPREENNAYVKIPAQTFIDSAGNAHVVSKSEETGLLSLVLNDTNIAYYDPNLFSKRLYPQLRHTTGYFTYQGVSLMGRFSLDPKPLLNSPVWLGREDLKLYGEATVLGVKDYPVFYNDIWQRIPVMIGFNFPGFKVLDVIGLEGEYCGNPFPNDWQRSQKDGLPQPGGTNFTMGEYVIDPDKYHNAYSKWRWVIYMRKEVSRGLSLSVQLASDHLRMTDQSGYTYEEIIKDSRQFWGIIRVTASY